MEPSSPLLFLHFLCIYVDVFEEGGKSANTNTNMQSFFFLFSRSPNQQVCNGTM